MKVWCSKPGTAMVSSWTTFIKIISAPHAIQQPVGYSNKSGTIFNLVRDDLGKGGDPNSMNYEVAYGRGHWPGEYVVNAMLYRSRDRKYPIGALIKLALQNQQGQVRQALQSNVELTFEGQETTVFRFRLDERGEFIADSMNRIHKNLRAAGRS